MPKSPRVNPFDRVFIHTSDMPVSPMTGSIRIIEANSNTNISQLEIDNMQNVILESDETGT